MKWVLRALPPQIRRPVSEANHLCPLLMPSSRNVWSFSSFSVHLCDVVLATGTVFFTDKITFCGSEIITCFVTVLCVFQRHKVYLEQLGVNGRKYSNGS